MTVSQTREGYFASNPQLHIHCPQNRPSWRRFGEGVANAEFVFYKSGTVSIKVEETAFASKATGEKRDVTRGGSMDITKEAATKLFHALGKHLEYRDIQAMVSALNGAAKVLCEPNAFTEAERLAVLHDVNIARGYIE